MDDPGIFISIVTPVYNRAATVERCIASVLPELGPDIELVLVDDASADDSVAVMRAATQGHDGVRIVERRTNGGVGPARNEGIAAARGQWVLFLDSDDELVPGALATIRAALAERADQCQTIGFSCLRDDGQRSPSLIPEPPILDYEGYLGFLEATADGQRDMMSITRRDTFDVVRYPENRATEDLYHLDFARRYRTAIDPRVVRLYHLDADNQLTTTHCRMPAEERSFCRDMLAALETVMTRHGSALQRVAPRLYAGYLDRMVTLALNDYKRMKALTLLSRRARVIRPSVRILVIASLGLVDPRLLSRVRRGARSLRLVGSSA